MSNRPVEGSVGAASPRETAPARVASTLYHLYLIDPQEIVEDARRVMQEEKNIDLEWFMIGEAQRGATTDAEVRSYVRGASFAFVYVHTLCRELRINLPVVTSWKISLMKGRIGARGRALEGAREEDKESAIKKREEEMVGQLGGPLFNAAMDVINHPMSPQTQMEDMQFLRGVSNMNEILLKIT